MELKIKIYPIEVIIIGLLIHSIGEFIFFSSKPLGYTICGFSIIITLIAGIIQIRPHTIPFKGLIRLLFQLYIIWILIILLRPLIFSSLIPLRSGFSPISSYLGLSYLIPFITFLGLPNLSLKSILKFSIFYGLIGIVLVLINYHTIFSIPPIWDFDKYQMHLVLISFPLTFLLSGSCLILFFFIIKSSYKILAFLCIFLSILIPLIAGRRGAVIMIIILIFFSIYLYIFQVKRGSKILKILLILLAISAAGTIFYVYSDSAFSLFLSRMEEGTNSRAGIEKYFFDSFKDKPWDWLIGRGINGTYHSPYIEMQNRNVIETGYLQLILSGGVINLFFFLFFLTYSAILGFFRSNNVLCKAMSFYLLYHIIYLYPYGLPSFSLEYLIVWIFILYCNSREWREKSDDEIKLAIFAKNVIE